MTLSARIPIRRSWPKNRRAQVASAAALVLTVEALLLTGPASAAPAAEPPSVSKAGDRATKAEPDEAGLAKAAKYSKGGIPWAHAEAKDTGKKTLVPNETTPTSITYANPDGSFTSELTAGPARMERDGKWVNVDANLVAAADGSVKAKAHPGGLELSGGGGTPAKSLRTASEATARDLVTLGEGDGAVTLQWKGGLPKPVLDGTRATYRDALPGADVIVKATRTGFEQYVQLNERPSGSYTYTLPLKAEGLKATEQSDGSVVFADDKTGAKRAVMPAPVMWDATVHKVSGKHENRHPVDMDVIDKGDGDVDLVVTPDAKWLADPATQYPVTVDPSTSNLTNVFDTYAQQGETVDLSTDVELDMGNPGTKNADGTPRTARSFITWNTAAFKDALVTNADVSLWNFHSGNTDCTARGWTIWDTTASSNATRWTNQPSWQQQYHSSTQTKGNPACTAAPDGWISADVTTLVQTWSSGLDGKGHMGLRAATDDVLDWKRVNSANATANPPKMTVTWNYRPGDGSAQQAGPPYTSYNGVWGVSTLTPTLRDKFTDADGDKVNGTFQVYDAATNTPIATPAGSGMLVSDFVTPGSWATVQVPAGQLVDGKTYKFRTNAYDGAHYNLNWSPWREFVVETAAAGKPTTLKAGDAYSISDPKIVKDPAKVQEVVDVFKRDGNLEALGIKPTSGPSAPQTAAASSTRAAWERTYTTPSTKFVRGSKPADQYEYINDPDECSAADDADNAPGWIKNRFSYCQETLVLMPAVKCGLFPPGCYLHGEFVATQVLIGKGKIGGLDGSEYTRHADFDFNLDVHWVGGDFAKPGAKIEALLPCEGSWQAGNASAEPEEACYSGLFDGREASPLQWEVDGDTTFDLWSSTPTLPDIAVGEQVAVGKFTPKLDFTLPGYSQIISSEGEEGEIRFDSAAYNGWAKLGSVFPDATPSLRYDKSDTSDLGLPTPYTGVEAVARHIDEARQDPDATYPTKTNKNLPGASPLNPLHRIVPAASASSQARYDRNEAIRTRDCNENTPGAPGAGKDCDEYPFHSSAEGAARFEFEGAEFKDDFSVRYIDSKENQEAGRRLGAWYQSDRILDWEAFTITIGD